MSPGVSGHDPMTFREQLLESAIRGLAMGVGLGIVTLAFVLVVMLATRNCKP